MIQKHSWQKWWNFLHYPSTFIWGKAITAGRNPTTEKKSSSHCDIAKVTLVVDDHNNDVQHPEQVKELKQSTMRLKRYSSKLDKK